jgi:DNA-binding transcriptional LysR family regulator
MEEDRMEGDRIDIALLTSLRVLIEERSVSRAATRLGLSQPAVSAQLKRLRSVFEDQLLTPAGRDMALTARARAIEGPLHHILGEIQKLLNVGVDFDPATTAREFRVGMSEYTRSTCSGPFVAAARAAAPNAALTIMPIDGINASERLVDGSIELFICGDLFLTEALKSLTVRSDHQVLVQRKGHPRGCGPVSTGIFSSYEFAGYEHHSRLGSIIDEGLAANELTRKVSVKAPSFLALADIVAQTDLIAILPSQVALLFRDRLQSFDLPVRLPSYVTKAAWHERQQADSGHRWLRHLAAEALRR